MRQIILLFFIIQLNYLHANNHNINLKYKGNTYTFICDRYESIYNAAKKHGVVFDFNYDSGATDNSKAKIYSGFTDNSRQLFLDKKELIGGYILITEAYPLSDCEIEIDSKFYTNLKNCEGFFLDGGAILPCSFVSCADSPEESMVIVEVACVQNIVGNVLVTCNTPLTEPASKYIFYDIFGSGYKQWDPCMLPADPGLGIQWVFLTKNMTQATCAVNFYYLPVNY